jgi:hypothetical protein
LKSPDLFRALAGLIREPHLTGAFRLDCKYVTLAATLSHPCRRNKHRCVKPHRAWLNVCCVSWAAPCRRRNCPCSGCGRCDWPVGFHRRGCNDYCTFSIPHCISQGRPAQEILSPPWRKIRVSRLRRSGHASCKLPSLGRLRQTVARPATPTHWTRGQCNRCPHEDYAFQASDPPLMSEPTG